MPLASLDKPLGWVKAVKSGARTYCWSPGILLSAIRAILYVVGSGLKGSRLRTTYLITRSSTCSRSGCQTHTCNSVEPNQISSEPMPQEVVVTA